MPLYEELIAARQSNGAGRSVRELFERHRVKSTLVDRVARGVDSFERVFSHFAGGTGLRMYLFPIVRDTSWDASVEDIGLDSIVSSSDVYRTSLAQDERARLRAMGGDLLADVFEFVWYRMGNFAGASAFGAVMSSLDGKTSTFFASALVGGAMSLIKWGFSRHNVRVARELDRYAREVYSGHSSDSDKHSTGGTPSAH